MNFNDLRVTADFDLDSWRYVLPDRADSQWRDSVYSGTFSVLDGSQVQDVTAERIARVDLIYGVSDEGFAQVDFLGLVELVDGSWATCMAWCDATGWDCQSDVQWKWSPTREMAISHGLDRAARRLLGVALPEDGES